MNSPQFAGPNVTALVSRVTVSGRSENDVANELFLTILARRPADSEQNLVREQLRRADGVQEIAYREVAWALLMSSEFSLNH
jgi:cell division protein FtsX